MSKIEDAKNILAAVGLPQAQRGERSALTLLALLELREGGSWQALRNPRLGVRAILDFCRTDYGRPYAENSRESFRKETLHQFVEAGLVVQNPDEPTRAPNSPKWCYQITPEALALMRTYGTRRWSGALQAFVQAQGALAQKYRQARQMHQVPYRLPDGSALLLSPGVHSELIQSVIEQFAPRFAPASRVLYVGDTGNKGVIHDQQALAALGVSLHARGKMPDAILYQQQRGWLYLIECVASSGPVDGKRYGELSALFTGAKAGLVFVTVFPDRHLMARFLPNIAWETEVWVADNPDHLIHFNGDRFLGPHAS